MSRDLDRVMWIETVLFEASLEKAVCPHLNVGLCEDVLSLRRMYISSASTRLFLRR